MDTASAPAPAPARRFRIASRGALIRLGLLFAVMTVGVSVMWAEMVSMPGKTFAGPLPPLTDEQKACAESMRGDVQHLAHEIGERNLMKYSALVASEAFITNRLTDLGYTVKRLPYMVDKRECANLEVEIPGTAPQPVVVIGAHYDSVDGSPGANDNGSGVAAMLALAERWAKQHPAKTLRFVAFTNEEPPNFQTHLMGSWVYAHACKERGDRIDAAVALETMGCYSDEMNSQHFPVAALAAAYPTTGNFITFIGDTTCKELICRSVAAFRATTKFPSEGASLPASIPGVHWSDHWAFVQHQYPALMVTDTAPFRYAQYHTDKDTAEHVDFQRLARVVDGVDRVIDALVR